MTSTKWWWPFSEQLAVEEAETPSARMDRRRGPRDPADDTAFQVWRKLRETASCEEDVFMDDLAIDAAVEKMVKRARRARFERESA